VLLAALAVPLAARAGAIPRSCESALNFKIIAQLGDEARDFETRLVLLGKHLADTQAPSAASEREAINIGTLRNALGEVSGYLLAAANLAAVGDLMVDDRDRAAVNRQFRLLAQQIQEPLSFGLDSAESVSAMTKHPELAAEVAKIHDFMDETRGRFAVCTGFTDR